MTLNDINSRVTFYTNATTTQYTAASRLIALNKAIYDIETMILQSQDEWDFDDSNKTDFPILTTDLVSSQQDYSLPIGTLKVKRAEITYDGTNWYKLSPFDIEESGLPTDDTSISSNFSKSNPYYDLQAGSLLLYPIPDAAVSGGLKLWISRSQTPFTSDDVTTGTKSPGFDIQFHDMVALSMSYDFAIAKGLKITSILKNQLLEYEQRLKQYYGDKQQDRKINLKSAYVDYN